MPRLNRSRTRARVARRLVIAQSKQRQAARRRGDTQPRTSTKAKAKTRSS